MEEVQQIQFKFRRSVLLGHVDLPVPRSSTNLEGPGNPASDNSHLCFLKHERHIVSSTVDVARLHLDCFINSKDRQDGSLAFHRSCNM